MSGRASGKSLLHEDENGNVYISPSVFENGNDSKELTPLEALKNIEKEIEDFEGFDENTYYQMDRTRFQIIENKLKALEIIKEKNVNVPKLRNSSNLEEYNRCFVDAYILTQEEYDLLKEILK